MATKRFASHLCDPRADDHAEDDGVEGELDEHAARCRHGLGHGLEETLGPPVQQHAHGDEDQVVVVEIERRERPAWAISGRRQRGTTIRMPPTRMIRTGLYSSHSPGFCRGSRLHVDGFELQAEVLDRLGPLGLRGGEVGDEDGDDDQSNRRPECRPDEQRLRERDEAADLIELGRDGSPWWPS